MKKINMTLAMRGYILDGVTHKVTRYEEAGSGKAVEKKVQLSQMEFKIFVFLLNADGPVGRRQLGNELWPNKGFTNIIDVHMVGLRKKLGKDAIRTIRGVGYQIEVF